MTQDSATAILAELIAFDTTSRNSNRPLIDYAVTYLCRFGIEPTLIWNDEGTKANLWATIGPDIGGGIILSGHTDTVPVDGQDWSSNPHVMVEREGAAHVTARCGQVHIGTGVGVLGQATAAVDCGDGGHAVAVGRGAAECAAGRVAGGHHHHRALGPGTVDGDLHGAATAAIAAQ